MGKVPHKGGPSTAALAVGNTSDGPRGAPGKREWEGARACPDTPRGHDLGTRGPFPPSDPAVRPTPGGTTQGSGGTTQGTGGTTQGTRGATQGSGPPVIPTNIPTFPPGLRARPSSLCCQTPASGVCATLAPPPRIPGREPPALTAAWAPLPP